MSCKYCNWPPKDIQVKGGGKTYVLMVTARKIVKPMLAPATTQDAIDAMCSFEVFPVAVSDDVEALRNHARSMCEVFPTIEGWNTFKVLAIGGHGDAD